MTEIKLLDSTLELIDGMAHEDPEDLGSFIREHL